MTELLVAGAVLTGGRSMRMGRDKALIPVRGRPLASYAVAALESAQIREVRCIGGDGPALRRAGCAWVADDHPGEGPLGAILTGLATFPDADVLVVLAGDLASPSPEVVRETLGALGDGVDLSLPILEGRRQWLHSAWRVRTARPVLEDAYEGGERSIHGAIGSLVVAEVPGVDPAALVDLDTPDDVAGADPSGAGELP
jgi:molybdenum cofactor guanylyltransferase